MNAVRPPLVSGLVPHVGAGTLATALHAVDAGHGAAAADILVCLGIGPSLTAAEEICSAPRGSQAILAVVHPGAGPVASLERLAALRDRCAEVVLLPFVPRWRIGGVGDEATHLLAHAPHELPADLREYAGALRVLVAVLLRSGLISRAVASPLVGLRPPDRAAREPDDVLRQAGRTALVVRGPNADRGPGQKTRTPIPFPELTRRSHHEATCVG